jgi:hypothetical protein
MKGSPMQLSILSLPASLAFYARARLRSQHMMMNPDEGRRRFLRNVPMQIHRCGVKWKHEDPERTVSPCVDKLSARSLRDA